MLDIKCWPFQKTPRILIEHENITCISVDLSNELDLVKVEKVLADSWKTVDAIVNNAGSFLSKPFAETTQEDYESVYKVNVLPLLT
jgi:short-subunit dehydrogenase